MTTESQKALQRFIRNESDPDDIEAIGAAIHAFIDCDKDLGFHLASRPAIYRMKKAIDAYMSASRQHIIDKLQSEEMVESLRQLMQQKSIVTGINKEIISYTIDCEAAAKAVIAAVLEGI